MSLNTNEHFNRQFIITDFRLLRNRDFIKFVGIEYGIYLILRESIWRSPKEHYMGLHIIYQREKKLASSLTRESIAEIVGIDVDNVSRHLNALKAKEMIEIRRTGRQSIYILGEWVDVRGNSTVKPEWYYFDGAFGIPKPETNNLHQPDGDSQPPHGQPARDSGLQASDLTESVRSETAYASDQTRRIASGQTRRKASDNNKEINREKTVNVNGAQKAGKGTGDLIRQLPNLGLDPAHEELIGETIARELGDHTSQSFYHLVAARIPESVIMAAIGSIKHDGARNSGAVFTHRMRQYAEDKLARRPTEQHDFETKREALAAQFSVSVRDREDQENTS